MNSPGLFVDTNLLVLFVTGNVDEEIIGKHRRLREYTRNDYAALIREIDQYNRILVTPNTLTETSNLLAQHGEPERSRLLERLRVLIHGTEEIIVASTEASDDDAFHRLGLTDSALIQLASQDTPLLTVDFDLYYAILQRRENAVVNFTHLRTQ